MFQDSLRLVRTDTTSQDCRAFSPGPAVNSHTRGHALSECFSLLEFAHPPSSFQRPTTARPLLGARPVVTCYLMPLAFSAVASLASHSCSCSCQQLYFLVAAKSLIHSCDHSAQCAEPFPCARLWPRCPGPTRAQKAFIELSLLCRFGESVLYSCGGNQYNVNV